MYDYLNAHVCIKYKGSYIFKTPWVTIFSILMKSTWSFVLLQ